MPSPSTSAAPVSTSVPALSSDNPSRASPTSSTPVASTDTLIEPKRVTPRTTSTRRSCQKRATDVGRSAGSAHWAETASRRLDVHQIPDHRAASSPRPATALRCATASSRNGITASDSAPGTASVIASCRSSSSVGLSHST